MLTKIFRSRKPVSYLQAWSMKGRTYLRCHGHALAVSCCVKMSIHLPCKSSYLVDDFPKVAFLLLGIRECTMA
jgi:hypothetical protein